VELRHEWFDDRVLLRPLVAPLGRDDGRRAGRAAVFRQTGRLPARLSRTVPGAADHLHHHGLGEPGNGEGVARHAWRRYYYGTMDPRRHDDLHRVLHDAGRIMGRADDRLLSIRADDGDGDCTGGLVGALRWWNRRAHGENRGAGF